jgi:fatty-acyl-CoA synthase
MLDSLAGRRVALEARFSPWTVTTTGQLLEDVASRSPDRPFVITDDATFSYRDVGDWARRIAGGLVASGVRPGDHVALVMANFPEFVAVKLGLALAGAVTVPINFLNRRDELGYILQQSDAVLLITMDRFRDLDYLGALDELAPGWERGGGGERFPLLREVVVMSTARDQPRDGVASLTDLESRASRDRSAVLPAHQGGLSDILYTSGTTGQPKGVLITHDMALRTAYGSAYARAFQDGRRILFSLPLYHVFGYVEGMLAAMFAGGSIVLQHSFDAEATLRAIERHRPDDALFVPTMTLAVLEAARRGSYDLTSLTSVFSSGGQSPGRIWQDILDGLKPEDLVTGYGMTETTASTTCTLPEGPPERLLTSNGKMKHAGVAGDPGLGGALAVYRVVDPVSGSEVPQGAVGELRARGPGITAGYYNKPAETAAAFDEEGWLRTGDLGTVDAEGYLALVGRLKECYRCGGEQVVPSEIEQVLTTHPAVAQAHVVALRDERMGEVGVAWVVFHAGKTAEAQELVDYCAERMARFKVPRHIMPIRPEDLPLTPSGKARKFLLAERAAAELLPATGTGSPGRGDQGP